MCNCSIALQILPMNTTKTTVINVVDDVIAYLKSTGVRMEVGPFETTLEGDFDELMTILKKAMMVAGEAHSSIFANVKINYNSEGHVLNINEKVRKHRV